MRKISLVIPMYNYAARIHQTIAQIQSYCSQHKKDWEIIFVDDGSTDNTVSVAERCIAQNPQMRVILQPYNQGKGAAVRRGLIEASGDYRIFTDCDLAYGIEQVNAIIDALDEGVDFAFADRRHPLSVCSTADEEEIKNYQQKRDLMSTVLNQMIHTLGISTVKDTQAGLKGFTGKTVNYLKRGTINGFPFDIELFAIASSNNISWKSVPVQYHLDEKNSTVVPSVVVLDFFKSFVRIKRNLYLGKYELPRQELSA